jgi:phage terminase large subunit-like protein
MFCATSADVAIYGGSAFGGKSWALAYEAARYATVPGYAAVIFRRTTPELTGGGSIWEETKGLYPHAGGRRRESPNLDWFFESGAWIGFRHLQYADTVYEHQGKQYAFIGFDEITHFEGSQFWYMLSRLRSSTTVARRVRATCNPDPDSFVRELIDWWIGPDGLAIEERSGVIRYMARVDERIVWGETPEDVYRQAPHGVRRPGEPPRDAEDSRMEPLSFTFIRAKATDNKVGLERDPTYLSRLALLPGAERERLLKGNWDARDTAGDYFNRLTFPILERAPNPINIVRKVRFWDKAATTPSTTNPDPDWTRGALVALLDDNSYCLLDLQSLQAGPGDVEALIKQTAETDGRDVEVGGYQDPAQAGKVDVHHMAKLLEGFAYLTVPTTKHMSVYAKAWVNIGRDIADPTKPGRFKVIRGAPYLHELWRELESFPFGSHDDIVACISGAMQVLTGGGVFDPKAIRSGADIKHPLDGVTPSEDDDVHDDDEWDRHGGGGRGGGGNGRGRGAYV